MIDESILRSVQKYLQACCAKGIDVRFGVLFGSQVKGTTHRWSDIDLVVVSPQFDEGRNREGRSLLWRIGARVDTRIQPIACGERQWVEDDASAIIEIARREGVRIEVESVTMG